jgi:hypothetical protein
MTKEVENGDSAFPGGDNEQKLSALQENISSKGNEKLV